MPSIKAIDYDTVLEGEIASYCKHRVTPDTPAIMRETLEDLARKMRRKEIRMETFDKLRERILSSHHFDSRASASQRSGPLYVER